MAENLLLMLNFGFQVKSVCTPLVRYQLLSLLWRGG